MAEVRRHIRPPSTSKKDSSSRKNKFTIDKLNDLAQDPQKISSFARLKMRSKSAKFFEEESSDFKKEAKKQAWAPKSKQNLSSSSSKFQRHGRVEAVTEYKFSGKASEGIPNSAKVTKPRSIKEFGRVSCYDGRYKVAEVVCRGNVIEMGGIEGLQCLLLPW